MKWNEIENIELEGVEAEDYPDMANASAVSAQWLTGEPLTDEELDILNEEFAEQITELAREVAI
jgi:hypothetical protein